MTMFVFAERAMVLCHGAHYCSLHVRESNYAAIHLYNDTLKFDKHAMELKYYADGEDAHEMRKELTREQFGLPALKRTAMEAFSGAGLPTIPTPTAPRAPMGSRISSSLVIADGTDKDKDEAKQTRKGGKTGGGAVADSPAVTAGASDATPAPEIDEAALAAEIEAMDVEPGVKDLKRSEGGGGGKGKKGKKR